jgi:DNA-nicking Smr family endonuclease
MARAKALSKADQQLWAAFSQNLTLLPGKTRLPIESEPAQPSTALNASPPPSPSRHGRESGHPRLALSQPPGLDTATWKNFATGKMRAVRRLDLHGFTAARAHHAVTHFIERAHAEQVRCVEIITGKGEVLAREVPLWLNTPGLRRLVLAMAHPHAANTGSVRVLLRRIR